MNLRATPFLRFFCPFAGGLLLGGVLDQPIPGLGYLIGCLCVGVMVLGLMRFKYRLRWLFGAWVFALLSLFGYFYMVEHRETRRAGHFSEHLADTKYVAGLVYDAPSAGNKLKIPIRVWWAGSHPDSMRPAVGNLLCFADTGSLHLRYGDLVFVRTSPKAVDGPKNPNSFDYRRYLHFQNIHHTAFLKADSLQVLASDRGNLVWKMAFGARERVLATMRRHFPTKDEYAVAGALLLGYKDELSEEMRTAYAETGSMHALAVSGTHVSMLYLGLMFIVSRLRRVIRKRWVETLLILAAIWAFTFLTGATASVLRASVMFSTYMVGRLFQREPYIWNVLPASACMLLLYNPYFLFDAGFQLSYAAVCGMVFFYPYFRRWIVASRYAVFREMQEVFWIGIAAQLGTVPLSLYYFNQFPFFFWLAGWIVVFGGAVFLWGGSILIALDALWPFLAIWLGKLLWGMLWAMNKIIFWIHIPTWGVAKGVWVPAFVVVLLYCCVFFLGKMFITKQARWLNAFLGLMLLLGLYRNYTMYTKSNQCRLVVYHVPQKTLLDFFDGREVYTLADSMGSRPLEAASMGNRWFFGMMGAPIMLDKDIRASYPNLIMERPFLQFFDQRMVLLDDARWLSQQPLPYTTDLLLVSRSPAVRMAQVHAVFPSKLVIFDASNSRKKVDAWRKECAEMGIACHDVRTQGAWMGNWER